MAVADDRQMAFSVKIEFDSLPLGTFADFLIGLRVLLVQSLITYLQRDADSSTQPFDRNYALRKLEKSYAEAISRHFDRRFIHDVWPYQHRDIFNSAPISAAFFATWVDEQFTAHDLLIESVEGGSIEFALVVSAILSNAGIDYNYSIIKDVLGITRGYLTNLYDRKSAVVSGNIESIPPGIVRLARDPSVKSLTFITDGEKTEFKVKR